MSLNLKWPKKYGLVSLARVNVLSYLDIGKVFMVRLDNKGMFSSPKQATGGESGKYRDVVSDL